MYVLHLVVALLHHLHLLLPADVTALLFEDGQQGL